MRACERARRAGPRQPQSQRALQKDPRSVVEVVWGVRSGTPPRYAPSGGA
ncbi:hypothetical protein Stsp01_34480 [Streptomyces sp. NBRC 13847]|nr:hypothetical protein Stsp01_34480 [Streptomyces sp. NBRC 13847]